jgi:threonine dehydratase
MNEKQFVTTTSDNVALHLSELLARKVNVANLRVGVVISGGNVGLQRFCALLARGSKCGVPS